MIFLWSKADKIGSRLIRWGSRSDCSHFSICFSNRVYESVYPNGFMVVDIEDWYKKHEEVHKICIPLTLTEDNNIEGLVFNALKSKDYDNNAIFYWTIRIAMKRFLGIPLPQSNIWGDRNKYYCVEVLNALRGFLLSRYGFTFPKELEMISPHESYTLLSKVILDDKIA